MSNTITPKDVKIFLTPDGGDKIEVEGYGEAPLRHIKLYISMGEYEEEVSALQDPRDNTIILGSSWWAGIDKVVSKLHEIKLNGEEK